MVTVLAYPTLAAALLALLAMALLGARDRGERVAALRYAIVCSFFQLCGACLLLAVFGWARLWQIARFSSTALQNPEYLDAKFAKSVELFTGHPAFGALCLAGGALGLVAGGWPRTGLAPSWPSLLVAALVSLS